MPAHSYQIKSYFRNEHFQSVLLKCDIYTTKYLLKALGPIDYYLVLLEENTIKIYIKLLGSIFEK